MILNLSLCIWILFIPFMGFRVLRSAGDEKVYVSQAYEMIQHQSWFVQYFQGVPDYYKGPFHYLSIVLGSQFFGISMWSTVYMNFILVWITSLFLAREIYDRTHDQSRAITGGFAFASCFGVYFYAFASQMEAELASFVTLVFLAFLRTTRGKSSIGFWLITGVMGWVKSPLFCVFATLSAMMAWAFEGTLWKRLQSKHEWLHVLAGALVSVSAYLPGYLQTPDAFYYSYVLRESFNRPVLGDWHEAIVGLLGAFLMPWGLLLLGGLSRMKFLFKIKDWSYETKYSLSFGLPILLFFTFYLYRGQSYGVYLCGLVLFWMFSRLPDKALEYQKYFVILLIVPIVLAGLIQFHFRASTDWWSPLTFPAVITFSLIGGFFTLSKKSAIPAMLALLISLSLMSVELGEREIYDVKTHHSQEFHFFTIHQGIWSEWGYLNFSLRKKINPIHTETDLSQFYALGGPLLVPGDGAETLLKEATQKLGLSWSQCVNDRKLWKKWKIRGADNQGKSYFGLALENRDLSYLERDYFIYEMRPCAKNI